MALKKVGARISNPGFRSGAAGAAGSYSSAAEIKAATGTNTNGVYPISIPNIGIRNIYCIMDSAIDGGGWMMMMKATRGTTFEWGSSYWTNDNVLNENEVNRNDGDAKFQIMNKFAAKDMLALWPDIGQGGCISVGGYPWIWLQNNFYGGSRIIPINFWNSVDRYFIQNANNHCGIGNFSGQADVAFYGYNYRNNPGWARTRWGYGWNENGGGQFPNGNMDSDDVSGGIGMTGSFGSYSAGDRINCCNNRGGINRSARVEIYVR